MQNWSWHEIKFQITPTIQGQGKTLNSVSLQRRLNLLGVEVGLIVVAETFAGKRKREVRSPLTSTRAITSIILHEIKMRTENVTAIGKQTFENFPIGYFTATYSISLNYSHFLKMLLRIHATLTIYVTQLRHSWVWQKIKTLKHSGNSALTSFTGYAKKWVKKTKPVCSNQFCQEPSKCINQ